MTGEISHKDPEGGHQILFHTQEGDAWEFHGDPDWCTQPKSKRGVYDGKPIDPWGDEIMLPHEENRLSRDYLAKNSSIVSEQKFPG